MGLYTLATREQRASSPASIPPSSHERIDEILARLDAAAAPWAAVPRAERAALLRECIGGLLAVAPRWVELACAAKGVPVDSPVAGEEWISGPTVTIRTLRLLAETLELDDGRAPNSLRQAPGGRTAAAVFPLSSWDRLLYPGISAEVWTGSGRPASRGAAFRQRPPAGVGVVLGAGNVGSIAPTDSLDMLLFGNRPVALKMNPVNEYLGPLIRSAFAPLVERGVLEVLYGGAEVGRALCEDPRTAAIHLTGSRATFDALVWGADADERERRLADDDPRIRVPVSAELGCVTPIIVAPGRWSRAQLRYHARAVASMVAHNASFNCVAGKLLVLPRDWYLRQAFLDAVRDALAALPPRPAYYPGAADRWAAFVERYPQAEPLGLPLDGCLPWTLIPDVPARGDEYALRTEAFCGVLAVVELDGGRTDDPAGFLADAVRFVNDSVEGTLSCTLLVSDDARRRLGGVDEVVAALRYGGVAVNVWSGVLFGLGTTTWGAYPGHSRRDVGSGLGTVHNALGFDHPERSVAVSSFSAAWPTPPWFADHRNLPQVGRLVAGFEAAPRASAVPALGLAALRG